jgi:predicted transcriptional regulator
MPATRPVAVKLDSGIHARIQDLAKSQDRSTHYLMREAIAQYVDREERREALRNHALKAWESYQLSGKHVAHDEAYQWMSQLEAGQDPEPPERHD